MNTLPNACDVFKLNLLVCNVGKVASGNFFEGKLALLNKIQSVEFENCIESLVEQFPLPSHPQESLDFSESAHIRLSFLSCWPNVFAKYYEMIHYLRVFAVIGFLDYGANRECWEKAISEFHRVVSSCQLDAIVRIFIFNSDETLETAKLQRNKHVIIPDQSEEKIQFYMQTLIEDVVSCSVKELLLCVDDFKGKQKEFILSPESLNEAIGTLEGLSIIKARSIGRKYKIVGDILALLGYLKLAKLYLKRAASLTKDTSDNFWNTNANESMYLVQSHLSLTDAYSFSEACNYATCSAKFIDFSAQYSKIKCHFLACNSLCYACNWLISGKSYHEASKCLIKLAIQIENLTDIDEKLHFYIYLRETYTIMNMQRKVSIVNYAIARCIPNERVSLSFNSLLSLSNTDKQDWIVTKIGLFSNCLLFIPDGYCLNYYANAIFNCKFLSELYLQLTSEQQLEIFDRLKSCDFPSKFSFYCFVQRVNVCCSSLAQFPTKFNQKSTESESKVFIYSPIKQASKRPSSHDQVFAVKDEPFDCKVTLHNPFEFEIELENISLLGSNFTCKTRSNLIKISPKSSLTITLAVVPTEEGHLEVLEVSYSFLNSIFNYKLSEFMNERLEFQVIDSFPLVQLQTSSNYIRSSQGQKTLLPVKKESNKIPFLLKDFYLFDHLNQTRIENYKLMEEDKSEFDAQSAILTQLDSFSVVLESPAEKISIIFLYSSLEKNYEREASLNFYISVEPIVTVTKYTFLPYYGYPENQLELSYSDINTNTTVKYFPLCNSVNLTNGSSKLNISRINEFFNEYCLFSCDIKSFSHQSLQIGLKNSPADSSSLNTFELNPFSTVNLVMPIKRTSCHIASKNHLIDHFIKSVGFHWQIIRDCNRNGIVGFKKPTLQQIEMSFYNQSLFNIQLANYTVFYGKQFEIDFLIIPNGNENCKELLLVCPKEIALKKKEFYLDIDQLKLIGRANKTGIFKIDISYNGDLNMTDSFLLKVVETLGEMADKAV